MGCFANLSNCFDIVRALVYGGAVSPLLAAAMPWRRLLCLYLILLQLYKQHVNPLVKRQDIFDRRGNYIPQNKWNRDTTNGAMHLIQVNNTLGAEIELAAGASIVRLDSAGRDITDVTVG